MRRTRITATAAYRPGRRPYRFGTFDTMEHPLDAAAVAAHQRAVWPPGPVDPVRERKPWRFRFPWGETEEIRQLLNAPFHRWIRLSDAVGWP